ncbi:hypothetical protein TPHA_0E03640 [Tetrapisispora phaffii CBS 4417]|uniref:non-specific serine/threonine protein kinase n=1 Tax=Tetrapisispora phaffii (strain ATCC 24235 / CBS 4417 / NBRC 1672 / NRRL Y-8282 / UCD 70-5) TaxID=1071381 RepID=G8BU75_TETPH|nr:hypothetical protein TPHA_0E03640 [Tetrapisispora phaffii CBS 4417]CCE63453.1 hypothetical protein TPHA_0E03640 [Tetrapisispora phaffii CBS 4417]
MLKANISDVTVTGNNIGPWKLGETLGFGSTGKVQLATNEQTNQQAAIKIISKSVFDHLVNSNNNNNSALAASDVNNGSVQHNQEALPYGIEREIIIMKLLNHTNVLRLYDVWETNNNLYMVLEYAEKGELFNLLVEKGPLAENEAVRFFRQIIIGMSYCHALGIVHRDLKPENILLDHKSNIKIADFGMAALETEDKLLETSCGSPHYAAPEIVSGLPYNGLETDIWSCGVILFALLTGRLPFDEEDGNIRNLLLKVQKGEFEMPGSDELSLEAQDLIGKILTVNPKQRIKTREILKHPLLQKYPNIKDSKTIRDLPREDTYLNPLADNNGVDTEIDESILQNLTVLWHGKDKNEIIKKLKEPGANAEKTLYVLLHRFKEDTERENHKNSQLRKRQSLMKASSSSSSNQGNVPRRRKNRNSMISVTSSHKKPVSYNKIAMVGGSSKDVISLPSSSNTTPASSKRISLSLSSSNKRNSRLYTQSNSSSPTPAPRSRRSSNQNLINKESEAPPIPVDVLKDYNKISNQNKRGSRLSKRYSFLLNNKRGSVTTKIMSTYAKLAEDDDWEFIEKETKRVSSDFATLIDEIFEHEKFEKIRKEKEELERKVIEAKQKEERERKEAEAAAKEEARVRREKELARMNKEEEQLQNDIDEEARLLKDEFNFVNDETQENPINSRSVSEPVKNGGTDEKGQRNFSLQTRPISRLDPGLMFSKLGDVDNNSSVDENLTMNNQKTILETIRRSKFLGSSFDINKELNNANEERKRLRQLQLQKQKELEEKERIASTSYVSNENQVLSKNAIGVVDLKDFSSDVEPRKISEVQVPQFTRKSKYFSESNKRLSVLSFYSSKQSYTNLVDMIKENPVEDEDVTEDPGFNFEDSQYDYLEEKNEAPLEVSDEVPKEVDDKVQEEEKNSVSMKLNFADRFSNVNSNTKQESSFEDKFPNILSKSGTEGLGLYSKNEKTEPKPVKSMIPEEDKVNSSPVVEAPLNKVVNKTRAENKSTSKGPSGSQKVSNTSSFLRKISGKSSNSTVAKGAFEVNLYSSVTETQLFNGLQNLLKGWTNYGLKDVKVDKQKKMIVGKLSNDNILSLRSTIVELCVFTESKFSVIGIRKKSGSSKTMRRLASEIEKVLSKEGVLQK